MSIEKTNVKMNEQLAESKRKDEENGKIKCSNCDHVIMMGRYDFDRKMNKLLTETLS